MARSNLLEAVQVLEQGSMALMYRPRVQEQAREGSEEVQRLLLLLTPAGSPFERLIVIGRKRLARSAKRDRFWGFVDLVLTPEDMQAALAAQTYGTATRGSRHLPAARPLAEGAYEVEVHHSHAHLRWHAERVPGDPLASHMEMEKHADYIITVANPDVAAWGLDEPPDLQGQLFDDVELHVPLPAPLPSALQQRFRGRRFAQLESIDWLDHPGTELVFVGSGD
ncbi:MAG: hypothetical protein ABI779_04225 [Acidobacteriota bacterium]